MHTFLRRVQALVGTRKFYYGILVLFVLQSAWIALSARYPQAFDEQFHLGLIRLHTQHWLPFFTSQPEGADQYGAVVRDSSYIYHYLMSLPYRVIASLTDSLAVQVIILRFMNIAMAVAALIVYAKLFARIGVSRALSNTVLLFLTLIPALSLLAAHINYDNLFFLASGLALLWTVEYLQRIRQDGGIDLGLMLQIIIVGLLASLIKYAYLPLLLVIGLVVVWPLFGLLRSKRLFVREAYVRISRAALVLYALALLGSGFLFVERYGVNLVKYHSPAPECNQVLDIASCQHFSPWARNYLLVQNPPHVTTWQYIAYPGVWVHRQVTELMFVITSHFKPDGTVAYYGAPPLPVANVTAWTVLSAGTLLILAYIRRFWRNPDYRFLLILSGIYTILLFLQNIADYINVKEVVAVHGRYLLPILPLLCLFMAISFKWLFERIGRPLLKPALLLLVLLFFLNGGGVLTWIMRSEFWWYWEGNDIVARVNWLVQQVLQYIVAR